MDGVDEDHRVHRIQGPDGPFGHLREDFVGGGTSLHEVLGGILLIVSLDTEAP